MSLQPLSISICPLNVGLQCPQWSGTSVRPCGWDSVHGYSGILAIDLSTHVILKFVAVEPHQTEHIKHITPPNKQFNNNFGWFKCSVMTHIEAQIVLHHTTILHHQLSSSPDCKLFTWAPWATNALVLSPSSLSRSRALDFQNRLSLRWRMQICAKHGFFRPSSWTIIPPLIRGAPHAHYFLSLLPCSLSLLRAHPPHILFRWPAAAVL